MKKRFIAALCIVLMLCTLMPMSAAADSPIDKVLCTTSSIPVAQANSKDIYAATSTAGCYIESYMQRQQAPRKGIRKFILRDVRLFLNSVNHSLDLVRGAGIDAKAEQAETDHEIVLTIRLPKRIGQTETVR